LEVIVLNEKINAMSSGSILTKDVVKNAIIVGKDTGKENWIAIVKDDDTDKKEETIIVISKEGYVFNVIITNGETEIALLGKEKELKPIIENAQISSTSYGLTVSCKVSRLETGSIKYSYSKEKKGPYKVIKQGKSEEKCEITGLEADTRYYIKIEAENSIGKAEEVIIDGLTYSIKNLKQGDAVFTYSPARWTNEYVDVGIEVKVEGYKVQYSLLEKYSEDSSHWIDYAEGTTFKISKNQTIWGRFVDGV